MNLNQNLNTYAKHAMITGSLLLVATTIVLWAMMGSSVFTSMILSGIALCL